MAKELKKEEKKTSPKTTKKVTAKPAKKTVRKVTVKRSAEEVAQEKVINAVYFLLVSMGFALLMVALVLKITNYITTEVMVISFALALVFVVTSMFVKRSK